MREHYVIDATMGYRDGLFCFCPVELDQDGEIVSVMTGLNYLSGEPPERWGKLVAIIHSDGQEAVEAFCEAHKAALDVLKSKLPKENQ